MSSEIKEQPPLKRLDVPFFNDPTQRLSRVQNPSSHCIEIPEDEAVDAARNLIREARRMAAAEMGGE